MKPRETARALHIDLDGRQIAYQLRRSARRTLGLYVARDAVRVAAPLRLAQAHIDAFLRDRRHWLLARLDAWAQQPPPPRIVLGDGAVFPLFDAPCRVRVQRGRGAAQWHAAEGDAAAAVSVMCASGGSVFGAVMRAIKARARADFEVRVAHFAAALGVDAPPLMLSSARTRWGSCSARAIRLNWRLIHFPPAVIDYVVAHEVAHLRHMNHSPAFWACVNALYPMAQHQRQRLRALGRDLPELVDGEAGAGAP